MSGDPYKYFRIEASELTQELQRGVLELEKGAASVEAIGHLFRLAHTLKGAARVVKLRNIADLAHALEDRLAPHRNGGEPVAAEHVTALLALVDGIARAVAELDAPAEAEGRSAKAAEELHRTVRADLLEVDALVDRMTEISVQFDAIRRTATAFERARSLAELLSQQLASHQRIGRSAGMPADLGKTTTFAEEVHRVLAKADTELSMAIGHAERELSQARDAAQALRLVPTADLFTAVERAVRDAAQSLGKQVRFEARGADVRLDAEALTVLQGALVQLARNAVAHGIERPADRAVAGKPPHGSVVLEISRQRDQVVFVCRDDGAGIDLEAVREAARRRGVSQEEARRMGPAELVRLLLRGGITTSGEVTETAGRGVGLDVVRAAIERLKGDVSVITERGRGTRVELVVPAGVASFEALLLQVSGSTLALPFDAVRRAMRVGPGDLARGAAGDRLVFDGETIPFVPLSAVLGIAEAPAEDRTTWSAVIVQVEGRSAALGADRLLGTSQVILRPHPTHAPRHEAVAGMTIGPDGAPRVVLDPDGLVGAAGRAVRPASAAGPRLPPVLVIDDSLTTRMLEQSILESAGYEVEVASSAEEGLERARRSRHALYLVDVEMPGMDGFAFVARTREDPVLRQTPAILVTSRDSVEDRRRGKELGASAYIVKSEFDQDELLRSIRLLVRRA